jgi:hypothetical protein
MGLVCRLTNWPRQAVYSLGALPLLLGAIGGWIPTPDDHGQRRAKRARRGAAGGRLAAPERGHRHPRRRGRRCLGVPHRCAAARVGRHARHTRRAACASRAGAATCTSKKLVADADWQPGRRLRWNLPLRERLPFPPGSLDDHVVIGGHYFELIDTTYTLQPEGRGTRLSYDVNYRISTQFNLYADWVARWLLGDFGDVMLRFYSGAASPAPRPAHRP